jgi:homoserine dehydrogenase
MGETQTRYHVSLDVADRAGVLAQIATAFADQGVSIESVRQQMHGEDDADLVIVTHSASDAALSATVEVLRHLEIVRDVRSVMRVEGT